MSAEPKIVVVGAGPTGLTLACQLLRRGTSCRIVDMAPEATTRSRAIGVSARSLEVLDEFGAADELVAQGLPSSEAIFYSNGRPVGRLTASATHNTKFPFLLAVPQSVTERVLEAHLERLGGAVERGVRLLGLRQDAARAELDLEGPARTQTAVARWVVGADGSHSVVRKAAGFDFAGDATGRVFANVDAHLDNGPQAGVGHYFFATDGMLVIAPLPGGVYRVTATLGPEEADGELTLAHVQELVDRRATPGIGVRELHDAGWGVARIRTQARIATGFAGGRCLLAGDAAHIYGPTGAQGMNGGIQDAHNLAWKLALVSQGHAPEALLATYASERQAIATGVLHHVEQQTQMATIGSRAGRGARDGFLRVASRTGLMDRGLAPRINQLDVDYRGSENIVAPRFRGPAQRAIGRRIPDVALGGPSGTPASLYGLLNEHPFTVLVVGSGSADEPAVATLRHKLTARHGDLVGLHVVSRDAGVVDRDGALHAFLRARKPCVCLVRPDRHVAARAGLADPSQILALLRRTLTVSAETTVKAAAG